MFDEKKQECACGEDDSKLLFPCSGGSDVGELSDLVARKMTRMGLGDMYCLAGVGGHVSGIIASTKAATQAVVIDGCPVACAKKTLEHIGVQPIVINLADLGYVKKETTISDAVVDEAVAKVQAVLNGQ